LFASQVILRKVACKGQVVQGRDRCRHEKIDYDTQCHGQDEHLLAKAKNEQRKELKYEKITQKPPLTETQSLLDLSL